KTLGQMRMKDYPVGRDGRSRFSLWPFGTKTGRNTPSTSENLMGAASWMRALIQAPPGHGLAYVDWSQQEYAIAAVVSKDVGMQQAYCTRDPYLTLAKRVGAVPLHATKTSHGAVRERYKVVSLGVLYGMGYSSLAQRLGLERSRGQALLQDHKLAFPDF